MKDYLKKMVSMQHFIVHNLKMDSKKLDSHLTIKSFLYKIQKIF